MQTPFSKSQLLKTQSSQFEYYAQESAYTASTYASSSHKPVKGLVLNPVKQLDVHFSPFTHYEFTGSVSPIFGRYVSHCSQLEPC